MLTKEDNELLCRVGPGTPMGELMREYWLPVLMSSELPEPDGPPERVRLLGEDLVAFRDSDGRVGLLPHHCPHRGASLFFGRNEEGGLRCVYHGWKFDVSGACVDMPNEPPESNFKNKIRHTAYPCQERGGVIWTYMGSRSTPPPFPELEPAHLEEPDRQIARVLRECNWLQAIEGEIDTSHFGFLHYGGVRPEDAVPGTFDYYTVRDRAPRYVSLDTDFGTSYGGFRPAGDDTYYWRIAHYLFPCFTMIPNGVLGRQILVRAWVPIDDEHVMFWSIGGRQQLPPREGNPTAETDTPQLFPGTTRTFRYLPNTSDWLGKWRLVENRANDYLIDREVQRTRSFTGIEGIVQQDQAITESMGPIVDRTIEHLGSADTMVIRTRLRLLNAVKALRERGQAPPGVDTPEVYRIRAGNTVLPRDADWLEAVRQRSASPISWRD